MLYNLPYQTVYEQSKIKKCSIIFMLKTTFLLFSIINLCSCSYLSLNQEKIDRITHNYDNSKVTENDIKVMKGFYDTLIFGGKIIYPEASKILEHYLYGDGTDLYINSSYFLKSKIISKAISEKKYPIGPVTLRISDDPRIAYAVNGFYIINKDNKPSITQRIEFDESGGTGVYTTFPVIGGSIKVPDRLIRIFEKNGGCKTFDVYIQKWYWVDNVNDI